MSDKFVVCTIVQGRYAIRALALYKSFKHFNDVEFYVLSLDSESDDILSNIVEKNFITISYNIFESERLKRLKINRLFSEYCWTCKPYFIKYIFEKFKGFNWVIYIDADSGIFGNLTQALPIDPKYSVILTPHRTSNNYFDRQIEKSGFFNAGFIGFKNDYNGNIALDWWLEKCTESCSVTPTKEVYGDQLYLVTLPRLFKFVFISEHLGINAAPWNISDKNIYLKNGLVYINKFELVHFHFQGFEITYRYIYDLYKGPYKIESSARKLIYNNYVKLLAEVLSINQSFIIYDIKFSVKLIYNKIIKVFRGYNNIIFYK